MKPNTWRTTFLCLGVYTALICSTFYAEHEFLAAKQAAKEGTGTPLQQEVGAYFNGPGVLARFFDAPLRDMPQAERLRLLKEENAWKNTFVMWAFPQSWSDHLPHWAQSWLRCLVLCAIVYFAVGCVWSYYVYYCFGDKLFTPGTIPAFADVLEQIKISLQAMPLYSVLPVITEAAAEAGWTASYPRIGNLGLGWYLIYFWLYMAFVEFCVYWQHRGLHDVHWAYNALHYEHHKYNKEHTLSPFAGLAFHPVDGIMQALPYTWTMFFCPMHFLTHELMLFATGVWTANIHDNIHGNVFPIMGGKYHTIHHTTYKHNYGHYTVFFDHLYGTLETPEEHDLAASKRL